MNLASLIYVINCGLYVPCCFSVNQHFADIQISSNIMEIMDIFRLCKAPITFTQCKVNIMQMIHVCAKGVINQYRNISTQILCEFKVSLELVKTVNNLKILIPHLTTKIWGKMLKHAMLCFIARAGMKTYTVLSVNELLRFQRNKWLQLRAIKTLNAVFLCHYYFSLY